MSWAHVFHTRSRVTDCRSRANVNGTQQKLGSYGETLAPTSKFSVIRTIYALASQENLTIYQFDIKGAFLLAPCKKPVYMNLPGRYKLQPGKALKCIKLLYGLKQSAFGWHASANYTNIYMSLNIKRHIYVSYATYNLLKKLNDM